MLEVCNYPTSSGAIMEESMKHSQPNVEQYEFNLGKAHELRCVNTGKSTVCGHCEACQLTIRLRDMKEWFHRLGDYSKKKLMLGLLRRIHSVDLLRQLVTLLQPVVMKDYMYARTRSQPSLKTDVITLSGDRALSEDDVLQYITSTWDWFAKLSYWSKANFAMNLLQACDVHLLSLLYTQANTLLVSERKATEALPAAASDYMETASIANTEYSYRSEKHPELQLLTSARVEYSPFTSDPFTGLSLLPSRADVSRGDGDAASSIGTDSDSVDPAILIIPTSSKAYSGVARYVDFISALPVHLSKYILGYLDQPSLFNSLCVNAKWRSLVEEVHQEHFVSQSLWEEVMLMQGAAAQGANPVYANDVDVLVPALHPGTYEVLETEDSIIKTTFKSEISFKTAYTGVVTRKVIMEERNVYCGAYNVMVLCDIEDGHRVIHTDGGDLISLGSRDRKVRFIDCESGKDHGPVITGHAGSIRCVHLCEKRGIVFSGSYDTSIRCWSIETGQCLKIFRGHTDTVLTVLVLGNVLASGAKDNHCKVWDVETGKCKRTFRHRHPVSAVALSAEVCITGCEGGRVKVWELSSGQLIKSLSGHHGAVTAIKFDRWHIVTGSRDGYALAWSAQGRHNRCLTALRHPKEVLCLEFMYLRVITGCGDGRLRIWNMVTGQCCRIMRGNSRSDPILDILAIGDRITLNTHNNLLVLNFEHVEWDYSLETDSVPPLVQYGSYSDAPVRSQPYAYVRAQRMKKAGASNAKLMHRPVSPQRPPGTEVKLQHGYHAPQLPHSAKSLSERSLNSARRVQSSVKSEGRLHSRDGVYFPFDDFSRTVTRDTARDFSPPASMAKKPPPAPSSSQHAAKARPFTSKSAPTVTIVEKTGGDDDSDILTKEPPVVKRRVSWAFDKPLEPKDKTIGLSEMKALLRSQIRMKTESIVPPDFIYLTVSTIQSTMGHSETNRNTNCNLKDEKIVPYTDQIRPSSSPSRIDPRTKIPIEELGLEIFQEDEGTMSEVSDLKSIRSMKVKEPPKPPPIPSKEVYSTVCGPASIKNSPFLSLHPAHVRTTIPKGRVIRPISAGIMQEQPSDVEFISVLSASKTSRPGTAPASKTLSLSQPRAPTPIHANLPGTSTVRPRSQQLTSAAVEASTVPMLMYPKDIKNKIEELKLQRKAREQPVMGPGDRPLGKVSPYNPPMRTHIKFELKTHEQEREHLNHIKRIHQQQQQHEQEKLEKKQRKAWLSKIKGQPAH